MRDLAHEFKVSARTAPEMHEAFNHLVLRAQAVGVKFRRRKVGAEAVINALLVDLFDRPEPERLALIARNVARFEAAMDSPDPIDVDSIPGKPSPGSLPPERSVETDAAVPRRRGERSG